MSNKFNVGDIIKHLKTGNHYKISVEPNDMCYLEESNEPYYEYFEVDVYGRSTKSTVWLRAKSKMEDGRFEKLVDAPHPNKIIHTWLSEPMYNHDDKTIIAVRKNEHVYDTEYPIINLENLHRIGVDASIDELDRAAERIGEWVVDALKRARNLEK